MGRDFVDLQVNLHGPSVFEVRSADVEYWDKWWQDTTYNYYRSIPTETMCKLLVALQDMVNHGKADDFGFLMQMPEYDREDWIRRARRDCHKFWQEDAEGFPPCGLAQSFRQVRALRKRRAEEKKRMGAVKKMSLGG